MYLSHSNIRLVTVREDGSVEILYKNQTYMEIPKEKVQIEKSEKEPKTRLLHVMQDDEDTY